MDEIYGQYNNKLEKVLKKKIVGVFFSELAYIFPSSKY